MVNGTAEAGAREPTHTARIDGPRGLPLVGNAVDMFRDPLAFLSHLGRDFGDVSTARFGPVRVHMVNSPRLIEELLVGRHQDCVKDRSTRDMIPLLGHGLFTSEGAFWRGRRSLVSPSLQPKRIRDYVPTMVECARRTADELVTGDRDIRVDMARLALEIIGKTLLGVDTRVDSARIVHILDVFMRYFERQLRSWEGLVPFAVPTPARLALRRALSEFDEIVYPMVERCRRSGQAEDHVLARMIHGEGAVLSNEALRDEVVTMIVGGHETTALALTYAMLLLARHPDARDKLASEVDAFLQTSTPSELHRLPFLNAVMRETFRLYPPAYAMGRDTVRDFRLGAYDIAAGSQFVISQYVVHRDPRNFPEPERFWPERWLDPKISELPRFAYFPFGGGPRVCVGNHFALLEIAIILGIFAQRLTWTEVPGSKLRLDPVVTLRVAPGLRLNVRPRGCAANS